MKNKSFKFMMSVTILFIALSINAQQAPHEHPQTDSIPSGKVAANSVCFVNNKYMGDKPQIPVEVDGKTYYGCCAGCVAALKNGKEARYAKDPLTGEEVDKATAYIVLKPGGTGEVWYFASQKNYEKYLKKK